MESSSAWWVPLPDAQRMREVDRWAIEDMGTPSLDLMERAGAAVAAAVEGICPDGPVVVVCGKGNNGGDGFVVARLLRKAGRQVTVLTASELSEIQGDAAENLSRLQGEPPLQFTERGFAGEAGAALGHAAAIVDSLLGTGFRGVPEGAVQAAIDAIDRSSAPVVSVDVPSGVDASSGAVAGVAVTAALTVSFHAGKPGLWIAPGKQHAGAVEIVDIGIPRGAPNDADVGLIAPTVLSLLPRRGASSTKFTSGRVIIAGGAAGLSGAPRMSGEAAMRAGAGYVTVCVPAALQPIFASGPRPELMSRAMPETEGGFAAAAVQQVRELADAAGALALGPGLGRSLEAVRFARELAESTEAPLVLDADGLNAHAGAIELLRLRKAPTVLTPHAGELGRLLQLDSDEVESQRLQHVRAAAAKADAVVLLKGDDTLIAEPKGRVAVSEGGSPALATAGTGDVLTGVIAALLAAGLDPFEAAVASACLHARAGQIAAEDQGAAEAVIASDVIAALGRARWSG